MMNLNVPDNEFGEQIEEICEVVEPYSTSLTTAIRNLFSAPYEKRMRFFLRAQAMQLKHEERMKILDAITTLAKDDKLSNDMFQLFMIAFSG